MAQELGLGVLPWGALKGGILSGKYTREKHQTTQRQRGTSIELTEKDYTIIDQLQKIASDLDTAVSTVALAWVQSQPGVTSTIIGARTREHLEANLKALDVHLTAEQIATLNAASKPVLNFPAEFNANRSPNYAHAGATVNGMPSQLLDIVPANDAQRY
jgi:aryl-alcohol dehydrogenase-like predicted oxidoreductase